MGYFSLFKVKGKYIYILVPQVIVSKLISKNFAGFPVKVVGFIAIFECEKQNAVELACETREILFYPARCPSFWKKLKCWLE